MLKNRIIPVLLLKNGRMIKTVQFDRYRDVGDPVTTARIYNAQRADELMFLDISASQEGRKTLFDLVRAAAEECFMPLSVGGGINSTEDIRLLLQNGADKVVINTAAVEQAGFIKKAAEKFGCSTIIVSIDARITAENKYEVYIRGGKKAAGLDPADWARTMENEGAGEILITSIDRDGTMKGLDIDLIRSVADVVSIPVIAAGGVGTLRDYQRGFELAGVSAVAAGSIFHFTDQNPIMTRNYLAHQHVNIRV